MYASQSNEVQIRAKPIVVISRIVSVGTGWICYSIAAASPQTQSAMFYLLSAVLLGYVVLEIACLPKDPRLPRAINPVVIGSVGNLFFSFGAITNFGIFWGEFEKFDFSYIAPVLNRDSHYVILAMALTTTAAACTWTAYYWTMGDRLFNCYQRIIPTAKLLDGQLNTKILILFVGISLAIRFYLFNAGLHGRLVSDEYFKGGYLAGSELRRLGAFCWIVLALSFLVHVRNPTQTNNILRWSMLISEGIFGFLYAARSAMIFPFMLVAVTQFYATRKFSFFYPSLALAALVGALTIGNEFKHYAIEVGYRENYGILDVLDDFLRRRDDLADSYGFRSTESLIQESARNFNKVPEMAAALRYADKSNDKFFQRESRVDLLTAPIHSLVPRRFTGIPIQRFGLEYKNRVLRRNVHLDYSIGFSPVGYIYFLGGLVGIVIGAFAYGVVLRFTRAVLNVGDLGFFLFLALMSQLYIVNTIVSGVVIDIARYLIFLPIAFGLLFKKRNL